MTLMPIPKAAEIAEMIRRVRCVRSLGGLLTLLAMTGGDKATDIDTCQRASISHSCNPALRMIVITCDLMLFMKTVSAAAGSWAAA